MTFSELSPPYSTIVADPPWAYDEGWPGASTSPNSKMHRGVAYKDVPKSPEHRANMGAGTRGKHLTQETKDKMSQAHKKRHAAKLAELVGLNLPLPIPHLVAEAA